VARLNVIIQTQADIAAAGGDRDRLMAVIVERAQDLAGADGAVVEVREGDDLVYRFASGMAAEFIGLRIPLRGSLSGLCHRTGELLTCADTLDDARVDATLCDRSGIRAMVVVPLTAEGEVVGLLKIMSRRPHAFAEGDVHTLRILAGFLGVAMSQAMARYEAQSLALRASQLAAIVESSTDAIYRMTPSGIITSWNPWAEKLFGYTAEEAIGQEGKLLVPPDQMPWLDGLMAQVLRGERVPPYEAVRYRRDGSLVPVSIAVSAIRDPQGDIIGLAVIARDITERVRAAELQQAQARALAEQNEVLQRQQVELQSLNAELVCQKAATEAAVRERTMELRESNRQLDDRSRELAGQRKFLAGLLDHLPGGVALVDTDLTFKMVNPAYAQMIGKATDEIVGRPVFTVLPGAEADVEHLVNRVLESGQPYTGYSHPMRFQDEKGLRTTYFDFTFAPFYDDRGHVDGLLALVFEVTPRVELERSRESQVAALQQAATIKDEFIAVASHELRTPLAALRNAASILAKGRAGPLTEQQTHFAQMMVTQVGHLKRLVDTLLDLHQLESGVLPFQLTENDLRPLIAEVSDAYRLVLRDQGVAFEADVPDEPLMARFDRDRLAQVMLNLLSNAAKFTPAGGTITVRAQRRDGVIAVTVSDTGPGIAQADLDRIFEKFVQVESSIRRQVGGTGLGLAIARRIVEEVHGGTLSVESRLGEGSHFTVALPIA
jgi:PAS domain S-box-containing protein